MPVTRVIPPRIRVPTSLVIEVTATCAMDMPRVAMTVPSDTVIQMPACGRMNVGRGKVVPEIVVEVVAASIEVRVQTRVIPPATAVVVMTAIDSVDVMIASMR